MFTVLNYCQWVICYLLQLTIFGNSTTLQDVDLTSTTSNFSASIGYQILCLPDISQNHSLICQTIRKHTSFATWSLGKSNNWCSQWLKTFQVFIRCSMYCPQFHLQKCFRFIRDSRSSDKVLPNTLRHSSRMVSGNRSVDCSRLERTVRLSCPQKCLVSVAVIHMLFQADSFPEDQFT